MTTQQPSTEQQTTPPAQPQTPPAPTTPPASNPVDAGWTPYVPDTTKSAQENLVLKEAHDKNVPAGHDPNVKLEPKAPVQTEPPKTEQKPGDTPAPLTLDAIKVPEGFTLDPVLGGELIETLTKHAGNPADLANALIALQVKAASKASETASQDWDKLQDDWKDQASKDPTFGGAKFNDTKASATQIVSRFGGMKLQETLELTGMGNHPEWFRFIHQIAPYVKEAGAAQPGTAPGTRIERSTTNLYPNQSQK